MKKGKFQKRGKLNVKALSVVLVLVLLIGGVIGGTLAWLTDKTTPVTNTFTASDINITLTETTTAYKMIPGHTIAKDPKVTVESGSEACYVFVKVEESTNLALSSYIAYAVNVATTTTTDTNGVIHGGWTKGDGTDIPANVYYRKVETSDSAQVFAVLGSGTHTLNEVSYTWENNEVLTKPEVTKEMMKSVTTGESSNQPTLTFTAYATQLYKTNSNLENAEFTAAEAWAIACPPTTGN